MTYALGYAFSLRKNLFMGLGIEHTQAGVNKNTASSFVLRWEL
ncbi:hypothetical protein NQX30_05915 [Candidatus Persebacteraceae bacterium Df01]|jgi:hypothetical protein|uniref:Trimeric autotransporter adhesin YadA-like C-terminal membrane anchor domain-containing protein n=1 Tax=Candidatus Doriopsillibacter californiensis TaxID=2970740 RepID=A0ABT7QMH3_9GAMM|nr:hypothetical protein [Candidatus Persebacteraceae bacterium Df01]